MPLVGTIVNVHDAIDGSELVADATATNTSITVADVDLDFNLDPEGGQLKIDDGTNSEILSYTVPDGSTGLINLGSALANSYVTGTRVEIYPQVIERWADIVEPDGEELLRCLVSHQLRPLIPLGPRNMDDGTAENVYCERQDGDMVVQNVLGQEATVEAHLTALGLDIEAGDSSAPTDDHKVRWLRASDGAAIATAFGFEEPTGLVGHELRASSQTTGMSGLVNLRAEDSTGSVALLTVRKTDSGGASVSNIKAEVAGHIKTLLDGDGASDYLLDNAWTDWTPTLTGWSANPTNIVYRYRQIGKAVTLAIRQGTNGTSNAATKTISLPVTAATISGMRWESACAAADNGINLTTFSRARITTGGTTIEFDKDPSTAAGGWTASGGHRIVACQITYEVS